MMTYSTKKETEESESELTGTDETLSLPDEALEQVSGGGEEKEWFPSTDGLWDPRALSL